MCASILCGEKLISKHNPSGRGESSHSSSSSFLGLAVFSIYPFLLVMWECALNAINSPRIGIALLVATSHGYSRVGPVCDHLVIITVQHSPRFFSVKSFWFLSIFSFGVLWNGLKRLWIEWMIALAGECRRRENNSETVFFSKFNKKNFKKSISALCLCHWQRLAYGPFVKNVEHLQVQSSALACMDSVLIVHLSQAAKEVQSNSAAEGKACAPTTIVRWQANRFGQLFHFDCNDFQTHTLEEVYARAVHCLIISSLYCPFCFNQKYIRRCVLFWSKGGSGGGNSHTKINDFQCQHSRIVDDDDRGLGRGTLNFFQKSPKSVSQPLCTAVPLPSNGWPDEEGAQGLLFCFVFAPGNSNDDEWMSASRQSRISTWWSWVSCEMVVAQVHKSTSSSSLVHSQLINESQEVWFDFLLCCCCWRTKFLSEEPTSVVVCQSSFNNTNYNNCTLAGMLCNL